MRSLVVDTDTASDDAVALLMAARVPGIRLRMVTTVAGNVPLPLATRNALITLERATTEVVPVHEGRDRPLLRPLETAQFVHGQDGMSGVKFEAPNRAPSGGHAAAALIELARREPGEHVLVTLGPLSNIATALLMEPELLTRFQHTYSMAGALDGVGNVHPVGEYNVWADPEAAAIVLAAPGDKTWVGWDVSRRYAVMSSDEQDRLRRQGPLGAFAVDINLDVDTYSRQTSGLDGFDLPDPIAMAAAIDPSLITRQSRHHVTIGLDSIGRGGSFVDHRHDGPEPNLNVAWAVDEAAFKRMLFSACCP